MRNLILSGGGDTKDSKEIDKFFVGLLPQNARVLYIPIAINTNKHPYEDCFTWIKSTLEPLGLGNITMWTDLANKTNSDLKKFDAIYIGGGNTFKLLDDFRSTGFDSLLVDFINNGGVVYGGSAGAIILSRDIDAAGLRGDVNEVGLEDTTGLNLINDLYVWCHYDEDQDKIIKKYIKDRNIKLVALSEKSGIYFNGSQIKLLGPDNVVIFSDANKQIYKPDSIINI